MTRCCNYLISCKPTCVRSFGLVQSSVFNRNVLKVSDSNRTADCFNRKSALKPNGPLTKLNNTKLVYLDKKKIFKDSFLSIFKNNAI